MTTLIFVRHGETDWNAQHRWQGHSDTALNDVGREQARRLAERARAVDALYSSDLARARETAEIIAERLGLEMRLDPRLRERGFGSWEGMTTEEIESSFPDEQARWRAGIGAGAHDAESFEAFAARVGSFVEEVVPRHDGEAMLVVDPRGHDPGRPRPRDRASITSATTGRSRPWPTAPRPVLPFGTENSRR